MKPSDAHILYYAESFCGLSETYVYRTAQCLSSIANTTILTRERENCDVFPDSDLKIRIEAPTSSGARRLIDAWRAWLACGVLDSRSVSPDLFVRAAGTKRCGVIFAQFGLAGVRALGAAKALNWPLIVNCHGNDVTTWLHFRGYARNLQILFRSPNVTFLVPSCHIGKRIGDLGVPTNQMKVYHNPVPIPGASARARRSGVPVFLHAGRLVPVKGITYTLKAFAKVASVHDCRLRVLGGGEEEGMASTAAAELGIADKVTFLGPVDHSVVQREMAGADVFVQHSVTAEHGETEGLPVAICEAMAHGLPVISTIHAGIPEVVENGVTGILVAERDVDAMANAMRLFATRPDLTEGFGVRGRNAVEVKFSINLAQSRLRCILEEAAPDIFTSG